MKVWETRDWELQITYPLPTQAATIEDWNCNSCGSAASLASPISPCLRVPACPTQTTRNEAFSFSSFTSRIDPTRTVYLMPQATRPVLLIFLTWAGWAKGWENESIPHNCTDNLVSTRGCRRRSIIFMKKYC